MMYITLKLAALYQFLETFRNKFW